MFSLDKIKEEELEKFSDWLASEIKKRGLQTPARFFLEVHKPFGNIMAHGIMLFSPFTIPFLGYERTKLLVFVLSKRELIDRLLDKLDS